MSRTLELGAAVRRTDARLAELYERHAKGAMRLAYLLTGDAHLAEDIAHEAFVRMSGRFYDLRNPSAAAAYLNRTVVNLTKSHFRKRRVERSYLDRHGPRDTDQRMLNPDVETRDEMWDALRQLPDRQRAVIVLRYYEDLTEGQTADVMQTSLSAVKSLAQRAMDNLRNQMVEKDRTGGAR